MTRMKWLFNLGHKIVCQSINWYGRLDAGANRKYESKSEHWIEGYTCVHYNRFEIITHCSLNDCTNFVAVAVVIARRLTSIYYGCKVEFVVRCMQSIRNAWAKQALFSLWQQWMTNGIYGQVTILQAISFMPSVVWDKAKKIYRLLLLLLVQVLWTHWAEVFTSQEFIKFMRVIPIQYVRNRDEFAV